MNGREIIDRAMSEKQWQSQVIQAAKAHGWLYYHTYDSRRSKEGFPDLVLVRSPRLIFAELKTETGEVSAEQQVWLDELRKSHEITVGEFSVACERCGELHVGEIAAKADVAEVYVWRPSDWDEVEETLKRKE